MELYEVTLSKEEKEKAEQIIHLLDGMTVYSACELLEKCKAILTASKVNFNNIKLNQ